MQWLWTWAHNSETFGMLREGWCHAEQTEQRSDKYAVTISHCWFNKGAHFWNNNQSTLFQQVRKQELLWLFDPSEHHYHFFGFYGTTTITQTDMWRLYQNRQKTSQTRQDGHRRVWGEDLYEKQEFGGVDCVILGLGQWSGEALMPPLITTGD